ncbi:IclR family transcriptional regulator [Variovorax sp. LT2P21]|uniref:IclR family transcriptional regulator n=1 Tax=Variovorax sp. LT2P21 TaxID=3443731 RepID=UPI003F44CAE2
MTTAPRTDTLYIQSLAKGMRVLECFADHPSPLSLNDIATFCDMDRSAAQRMAYTLVSLGYLERGVNGRGFVLGKKILERTFDYLRSVPLLERATPLIVDVQKESGERVELSLFDDLTIIFALRRQTKRQTYTTTLIGRRLATIHTASGRAVMSHLPAETVDDIIARSSATPLTSRTVTDPARIRELVAQAGADGYALASEESMLGEINLASAVLDHEGKPIAAIDISGSLADWTAEEFAKRFSPMLIGATRALSGKPGLS